MNNDDDFPSVEDIKKTWEEMKKPFGGSTKLLIEYTKNELRELAEKMESCHGCGVYKDRSQLEMYPYPEHHVDCEEPVPPLIDIDCSGSLGWRNATVCHHCYYKLDMDLWISERCWVSINPVVSYSDLPLLVRKGYNENL